ncbi:hypothetical protein KY284_030937 [Solanum tuberosum]|nr:hypothetical protein KY284_030937 [Solanum tuberosum]
MVIYIILWLSEGHNDFSLTVLPAKENSTVVAEKEQQNAVLKVKEAKAAANKSEDLAVRMRQKAQQLMENADLATYKAMMALKIAEAAKIAKSKEAVGPIFLG